MLTEFTDTSYHWASRVAVIKSIKATFKKLTGYGINELVSASSYQQVLDTLSVTKIPHCTFADWLRKYEWKTPQQSENNEDGNTFAAHIAQPEPEPQPQPQPVKVIDVFLAVHRETRRCYDDLALFMATGSNRHPIQHPWNLVDSEVEKVLKLHFRNRYPSPTQLQKVLR